jgi:glycosyltransferase involved in cell wall biosynthesis
MNIKILTEAPFPYGMAVTNRIISYSRGIVELGHDVEVVCLKPTEKDPKRIQNKEFKGDFSGIRFYYSAKTTLWQGSKFQKIWLLHKGMFGAVKYLRSFGKNAKPDVLLLVSNKLYYVYTFYIVSRLLKIPYFQEKSEFPFVLRKKSKPGKMYARFYVNSVYKLFDGLIVMTKPLIDYFKPLIRRDARMVHIPMTVESERFNLKKEETSISYIAYCGTLGGNKDGVPILIDAFGIIAEKYPRVNLYIIGGGAELPLFKKKVEELGLKDRVVFTGRVSRDEMPGYLVNAEILALARPSGLQSQGGFPTKLGEYLSTANPVVVTKVGEIPAYLDDKISAVLAEPDSANEFAKQLEFVLSNPEEAAKIGAEGKRVAIENFDYKKQSARIVNFFLSFTKTK